MSDKVAKPKPPTLFDRILDAIRSCATQANNAEAVSRWCKTAIEDTLKQKEREIQHLHEMLNDQTNEVSYLRGRLDSVIPPFQSLIEGQVMETRPFKSGPAKQPNPDTIQEELFPRHRSSTRPY